MRVQCLLRNNLVYRKDAFLSGFAAAGYEVVERTPARLGKDDVLVIWNRYGINHELARAYEGHGGKVIVCENGHLGKGWRSETWLAMALNHHAGAGTWRYGGPERWDSWNEPLASWRTGSEYLVFAQRGIGEPGLASPQHWAEHMVAKIKRARPDLRVRIRAHPGASPARISLEEDLRDAAGTITWHSAAAMGALKLGVPAWYDCPTWIGRGAGKPVEALIAGESPNTDTHARLETFRHMAWAMWKIDEISNGDPFRHLLEEKVAA